MLAKPMVSNLPLFEDTKTFDIEGDFNSEANLVLYHGDVNDFLATIPDESIKLIITSPPYNLGKEYENRTDVEIYLDT